MEVNVVQIEIIVLIIDEVINNIPISTPSPFIPDMSTLAPAIRFIASCPNT